MFVGLTATADPVARALLLAPIDDEPDTDDDDGGLTEARRELASGEGISMEEIERAAGGPSQATIVERRLDALGCAGGRAALQLLS